MSGNTWKVWSTMHPHLIDLSDEASPPDSPKAAASAACAWNLNADGGFWFVGTVATVIVESPTGERTKCAAWLTSGPERMAFSSMVSA